MSIRTVFTPFRVIMALLICAAAFAGVVTATATPAHGVVSGYLRDGNGSGKAASAVPGHAPVIGENVDTFGTGAWKTQWNADNTICLVSAPHYCFADNSGLVKWRSHDASHSNQQWVLIGGSEIQNVYSRNYLCATGGNDFVVITQTLNNCSSYHSSWQYEGTALKQHSTVTLDALSIQADDPHCIQDGTKHAYLCYYHQPGTGGGVYATLVLFENWYYWHPKTGDQVVDETYVHSGAPGFVTDHRTIHFGDTREIADAHWLANFPHNSGPPGDCESQEVVQACTQNEQQSAMDFQHAMVTDQIHHSL